ncbi:MAG TPA: MBL fold metallo-hydrolase [Longimicrobium sp.]|nr:MBL fold metallo-hydrolase [Longimicrobium sp.]
MKSEPAAIHQEAPGVTRIDHGWAGPGFIASYLVADGDALALVEAGPASTLDALTAGIRAAGHEPERLTDLLLTHVHLDHAAGAGRLARMAPRARVWVHGLGAPHLADPSRLLASARRLYGDLMDAMWGTMLPVPRERIRVPDDGEGVRVGGRVLRALDTPGHASHHLAFHDPDAGLVFTGDAAGIRLDRAKHVRPPTPPPELDTPRWLATIDRLRRLEPALLLPTHFGAVDDAGWHLDDLAARLAEWTRLAAEHADDTAALTEALRARGDADLLAATGDPGMVRRYAASIPYEMMAAGLARQERSSARAAP